MTDQERLMLTQHALALTQFLQTFFTCEVATNSYFLGEPTYYQPDSPIFRLARAELNEICHRLWPT